MKLFKRLKKNIVGDVIRKNIIIHQGDNKSDILEEWEDIYNKTHPEYNNLDYINGTAWYEDDNGVRWSSKSEMRNQKLKELGI